MQKHIIFPLLLVSGLFTTACTTTQQPTNKVTTATTTTVDDAKAEDEAVSDVNLSEEMKMMAKSFKALSTITSAEQALYALNDLRASAEEAKEATPSKVGRDAAKKTAYQAELDRLIDVIDQAIVLVEQNNLSGAQALTAKMISIRDAGHKQFK